MTATVYGDPVRLYARMLRRCVRTEDGCWMFTGSTNSRGYSIVCSGKKSKNILGHQLVLLARGEQVPDGHNIDHSCHDSQSCLGDAECPHRRCVNPSHIRVVTIGDNTRRRWGYPVAAERPSPPPTTQPGAPWLIELLSRYPATTT